MSPPARHQSLRDFLSHCEQFNVAPTDAEIDQMVEDCRALFSIDVDILRVINVIRMRIPKPVVIEPRCRRCGEKLDQADHATGCPYNW